MQLEEIHPSGTSRYLLCGVQRLVWTLGGNRAQKEIKVNTIVFPTTPGTKPVDYVHCLENHVTSAEIFLVHVSTAGQCRITFSSDSIHRSRCHHWAWLCAQHTHGSLVLPQPLVGVKSLLLHQRDIPVQVPDCAVEATLSLDGAVMGPIGYGRVKMRESGYMVSSVQFALFKQSAPIKPSCRT